MGYILPNQSDAIRTKYGSTQKVGNVFKFVYNYTEIDGRNKGKTTYLKFAVHVITPKMERDRATQRKRDAIQAAKDYIIGGNPAEASKLVNEFNKAWGGKYPTLRIEFEDFSVSQIMKDYAKKVERKREEWEYKP